MCGSFFLFYITMSNNTKVAASIELALQEKVNHVRKELKSMIRFQISKVEDAKANAFHMIWDPNCTSKWTITEHFRYISVLESTLNTMKSTYLEWYGEEWDYEAPVEEPKKKAGRPKKK